MRAPHRRFFDLWSHFYDLAAVQRAAYHPVHDAVLEALRRHPPAAILDVGCGTGQLAARLRAEFPRSKVTGCDFSAGMLRQAAERDRHVDWVCADATRLPFAADCFDTLTCTEAFHWFPDQQAALKEFHRVLEPGGRAAVALINPRFPFLSEVTALGSHLLGEPFYWPTSEKLQRTFAATGFRTLAQRPIGRIPGMLLFPAVLSLVRKRG